MRKALLLLLLQAAALTLLAQRREPVNPQKDKRQIEGFTVRLLPAPRETYLYEILKGNRPIPIRPDNPFTQWPEGFETKEDAYKVATWFIRFYKEKGIMPPAAPPSVADELKISIPRLHKLHQ